MVSRFRSLKRAHSAGKEAWREVSLFVITSVFCNCEIKSGKKV